jgi:hypothetical protein
MILNSNGRFKNQRINLLDDKKIIYDDVNHKIQSIIARFYSDDEVDVFKIDTDQLPPTNKYPI